MRDASPERGSPGQLAALSGMFAAFALFVAVFSAWPSYRALQAGDAVLKVSFIHHGERVAACRSLTAEELAWLPPNMRAPLQCPRERTPVTIEVELDGVLVLSRTAAPSGLSRDGASTVYHRAAVAAGGHRLRVRLRDAPGDVFRHVREADVVLRPAQVLVIDFDPVKGITLT